MGVVFEQIYHVLNVALAGFLIIGPFVYFLILIFLFKSELKRAFLPLIFFLFLTTVFLNKLLFGPWSLAQKDFNNIQIPLMHFFGASIRQVVPPIWNSLFCGGFDAFSNPLTGYFSMFNWLFLVGTSVYASFNFFIFVQVFLCLIFAYLMLRVFSFSKIVSVLGAVVFTFNGFVTMRLSPGVGVEYLFAYKWVPLLLAFSKRFFDKKNLADLFGLAIAFAFLLEGNPNMAIAAGVLWGLFVSFNFRIFVQTKFKVLLSLGLSVLIYAVKVFPAIALFTSDEPRFSGIADNWRKSNYDLYMYPKIFLPIKSDFTNGVFTPGILAIILFCLGLCLALILFFKFKKNHPFNGFLFFLAVFILAFFITIENPVYYFFYDLPILRRVTIIPSFVIFYILPIVFFASFGFQKLLEFAGRHFWSLKILLFGLPILLFLEVLLGLSLFGSDSYSFNFAKMDYTKEPYSFPHYNVLVKQKPGVFFVIDSPSIFVYPYALSLLDLQTLNHSNYFFGCNVDTRLINIGMEEIKPRVDYVLSMWPLADSDLRFIAVVGMNSLQDHKSHAVFERMTGYRRLYEKDINWDDDMYVYRVIPSEASALKNHMRHPTNFVVAAWGERVTSINYSKWLRVKNDGGFLQTFEGSLGYLEFADSMYGDLHFFYVNPYIYVGFAISLSAFVFVMRGVRNGPRSVWGAEIPLRRLRRLAQFKR